MVSDTFKRTNKRTKIKISWLIQHSGVIVTIDIFNYLKREMLPDLSFTLPQDNKQASKPITITRFRLKIVFKVYFKWSSYKRPTIKNSIPNLLSKLLCKAMIVITVVLIRSPLKNIISDTKISKQNSLQTYKLNRP